MPARQYSIASRLHIRPRPPNLRQVHLMPVEFSQKWDEQHRQKIPSLSVSSIRRSGGKRERNGAYLRKSESRNQVITFVAAGEGPKRKHHGSAGLAVVEIQGLRNPCPQIDKFQSGLPEQFIVRDENRMIIGRLAVSWLPWNWRRDLGRIGQSL